MSLPILPTELEIRDGDISFTARPGETILAASRRAGVSIPHTCGGKGECHTCRFDLLEGELTPLSKGERRCAEQLGTQRLSCQSRPRSDLRVSFVGPVRMSSASPGDPGEDWAVLPADSAAGSKRAAILRAALETTPKGRRITMQARPNARIAADRALLVSHLEAQGMPQAEMNRRLERIAASDEEEISRGTLRIAPNFGSEGYTDEEYWSARRRERLLYFNMEFTNTCNLACTGCFAGFGDVQNVFELKKFEPGHMKVRQVTGSLTGEELMDVIDQAADLRAKTVDLIGGGEPLSSAMFFTLAEHAFNRGLEIEVFTNGTLITPDYARRMAELRVVPYVKLYSARSWVHDAMVGVQGAWERAVRGIENLVAAGYGTDGLTMSLESIVVRRNAEDMPTLWRWARENGMIPYFERFVGCHYDGDPGELLSPTELKDLWEDLWLLDRGEHGFTWPLLPLRVGYTCATNFYSLYVNYEGDVRPCSGTFVPLGNVRETPLARILEESPVVKDLREYEREPTSWCAGCYYYLSERCPGCRGMAQAKGSYMADDPLCFHNPGNLAATADPRNTPHLGRIPTSVMKGHQGLQQAREAVVSHGVYAAASSPAVLRAFMESHVFAVWDFLALLRRLRGEISQPASSGYLEEVLRAEESDLWEDGRSASHLDRYLEAMEEVGADTALFRAFQSRLAAGDAPDVALEAVGAPWPVRHFVSDTLSWASNGDLAEVAAVYLYSREDVLPEIYQRLLTVCEGQGEASRLVEYLERHLARYGEDTASQAKHIMDQITGQDPKVWDRAALAAERALLARKALWDGILAQSGSH
jgi:radical SAM protein with 4Fe4S-binding SPASM domain